MNSLLPIELILLIFEKLPTEELGRLYFESASHGTIKNIILTAIQIKTSIILTKDFTLLHLDKILKAINANRRNSINIKCIEINYNFLHQHYYKSINKQKIESLRIGTIYFHKILINPFYITKLEFINTIIIYKGENIVNLIYKCKSLKSLTLISSEKVKLYLPGIRHLNITEFNLIGKFICNVKFEIGLSNFLRSQRRTLRNLNLSIKTDYIFINRLLQGIRFGRLNKLTITTRKLETESEMDLSFISQAKKVTIINYNSERVWSMYYPTTYFGNIEQIQLINISSESNLIEVIANVIQNTNWNGTMMLSTLGQWLKSEQMNVPLPILTKIYEPKKNIIDIILNKLCLT